MLRPEEGKSVYSVVMQPSMYAEVRAVARERGMSFSEFVRVVCKLVLDNEIAQTDIQRENTKKVKRS